MQIGIALPTVGPAGFREFVLPLARQAESLGFHSVWVSDHVILPKHRKSIYPYPESTTEAAFTPGVSWLDPVSAMGVIAGATEKILIGTNVLVLPYRNPIVLANEVASLDLLSEGRILLGVGVGWMDEEFQALGVPKSERAARTDEYIQLMRELWRGDVVSYDGKFVKIEQMQLASSPHTPGGPPILIGGNTAPALSRAGRLGDGWLGFEIFPEDAAQRVKELEESAVAAGRDPGPLFTSVRRGMLPPFEVSNFLPERRCVTGSPEQVAEELATYQEAGIDLIVFDLTMLVPEMEATMDWLSREVMPLVS